MRTDATWRLFMLAVSGLIGYYSGQVASAQRLATVETVVDERYRLLMSRIDGLSEQIAHQHEEMRDDLAVVRSNVLQMAKERGTP